MQPPSENNLGDTFNFVKGLVRRQYALVIFTTAISLVLGALYLVITPPTYTAHTRLLLGNPNIPLAQQQWLGAELSVDRTLIDTQLQVLRSRTIIASAIQQLKLGDNSELKRSGPSLFQRIRLWFGEASSGETADQPSEEMIEAF